MLYFLYEYMGTRRKIRSSSAYRDNLELKKMISRSYNLFDLARSAFAVESSLARARVDNDDLDKK